MVIVGSAAAWTGTMAETSATFNVGAQIKPSLNTIDGIVSRISLRDRLS